MNLLKLWRQKLLLILAGVLSGLLIIETFAITTGIAVSPEYVKIYESRQPDAELGFRMKPNLRDFEIVSKHNQISTVINTDSYGFRNLGRDYAKSNLYFIGDSFTWGEGITEENTFARIIESSLKQPVINLGVPSYGFGQYKILFRDWVAKYKPNTAVLCVFANDLTKQESIEKTTKKIDKFFTNYISLPWYKKSFLYQSLFANYELQILAASNFHPIRKKTDQGLILLNSTAANEYHLGTDIDYLASGTAVEVEAALSQIIDLARQNQVRLLVFLIPSKESTYITDYARLFPNDVESLKNEEIGYRRLCEVATTKGIICVDLTEAFRKKGEKKKLYFDRDLHWNITGQKLAASLISETLVKAK